MNKTEVMSELKKLAHAPTKQTYLRHGAREPLFGVRVGDLKKIVKKVKKDHALALELYDTGNSDAMYLAGLIADETKITPAHLKKWVKGAYWGWLTEYTVPWVASETSHGWTLGLEWIGAKQENVAASGWSTLSNVMSIKPDAELDLQAIESLLARVERGIGGAKNRVRYVMNGFVIAAGAYVKPLHAKALAAAERIGAIEVDMGGTACKVPPAADTIRKIAKMGRVGKKRKTARC